MELIASGHGDNDFFMDPVRVKWPGPFLVLQKVVMNTRVNITFIEYVNAFMI